MDVVDLLQDVYDIVSPWAADGIVFPELRDKLANEPARVLAGWAQYAPSRQCYEGLTTGVVRFGSAHLWAG